MSLPDLLEPAAACRVDETLVGQGVVFAFAVGEGAEQIERGLSQARVSASSFDASHFATDLFLGEVVEACFPVTAGGRSYPKNLTYLTRVVAHPPKDPATTAFRRAILRELATHPELRRDLEDSYVELRSLRDLLTTPAHASVPEQHGHRVDVLRALKATITGLASRFESSTSGLARCRAYGAELAAGADFKRLCSLLEYEDGLANVEVELRVGADGSVRGFSLARIREAEESPFYRSPLGRIWTKLVLFFRGYRFAELELLARLLDEVFDPFQRPVCLLLQLLGDMEVYLGALGFHDLATSRGLAVSLPELVGRCGGEEETGRRELFGLFNPLLIGERGAPRPCDIVSGRHDAIVIVTGPNSGGKTRLLQALAITQLFGQCGLFVPARSARLSWTEGMFVSLHHEISADQKEGRLGTELMRIRALFEELSPGDLVLFDELCSGTNPSEAEAIIRLVLELLSELNPQVFVTTHFLDFAKELEAEPPTERLEFLRAALDERNRPTYQFERGVAKTALAAETAARLGVTLEELASIVARRKRDSAAEHGLPDDLAEPQTFGAAT